jgi:DNA-binding NarL/FixJ family response regulator
MTPKVLMHILIADDQQFVRTTLHSLLKNQHPHWEVSEASDGQEAVEVYRKSTPDVAVLDIVMPVKDAARQIWKAPAAPGFSTVSQLTDIHRLTEALGELSASSQRFRIFCRLRITNL